MSEAASSPAASSAPAPTPAAGRATASRAVLRSYYCLCGDFVLVMQGKLDRLPRRRTDGAYILRSAHTATIPARKFKLSAVASDRILLERRGGGTEVRQGFVCGRCKTPVAYQTTAPPAGSGPFLYILKGAMTELQGRIPHDAFDEEERLGEAEKRERKRKAVK